MDYRNILSYKSTLSYFVIVAFFLPASSYAHIIGGTVSSYPQGYSSEMTYNDIGSVQLGSTGIWGPPDPMLSWNFATVGYIDLALRYEGSLSDTFYIGMTDPVGGAGVMDCQSPQKSFSDWGMTDEFKIISFPVSGTDCDMALTENGIGYSYYYVTDNGSYSSWDLYVAHKTEPSVGPFPYVRLHSGTPYQVIDSITATTTWSGEIPYIVSGNIEIEAGVTLSVEPGVVVLFDTATSSGITVSGTLNAEGGSGSDQIVFSSSSTSPMAGDWSGILIESGGVANLTNTIVQYAGATSTNSSQIYNNGGILNLVDSRVIYGTVNGVKNNSGTANIEGTELAYHDNGYYHVSGTADISNGNIIHNNGSYGIFNNTTTTIDAENNYWELPSGPYHPSSNPSGLGDSVSDYVDFNPWTVNRHFVTGFHSVSGGQIAWNGTTTPYTTEWDAAVTRWNDLASIEIVQDSNEDLSVDIVDRSDVAWVGTWNNNLVAPDEIKFNHHFLQNSTTNQILNTITHELGHALGLGHSYTGNVMYYSQTSQFILGDQDIDDYYYLWP